MHTLSTTMFANAWHHDGPGWWIGVLEARYARGEIDVEEYRERRSVLTGHGVGPSE